MISVNRGTGYSRMELGETYSTGGLMSLEAEWAPSSEGLKFEVIVALTVTELTFSYFEIFGLLLLKYV